MLGENIKRIRMERGFTQEELAIRLHVVRQTVSKWEKNLSVPDADLLQRLSQELEASVSELLGGDAEQTENQRNEIAEQLSRINEQLAVRNRRARRIWRVVAVLLGLVILLPILGAILFQVGPKRMLATSVSLSEDSPYTEQDAEEMFAAVQTFFKRSCKDCTLETLMFDDSDLPPADNGAVVNVRFRSGDHPKAEGVEPNRTYRWAIILHRTDGGAWEVFDWEEQ